MIRTKQPKICATKRRALLRRSRQHIQLDATTATLLLALVLSGIIFLGIVGSNFLHGASGVTPLEFSRLIAGIS